MFKAKRKSDGQIYQVLDTYIEQLFHQTYFLVWNNGGWRWYSADGFVPPNVEIDNG